MHFLHGFIGIAFVVSLAWLASERRQEVRIQPILITLAIQLGLAYLLLAVPAISNALRSLNLVVVAIEAATLEGTKFVFDYVGGGELPFELREDAAPYIFAFRILPQILVFSVLVALTWHWKILPSVIKGFSYVLQRGLKIGGAVGLAAAASIFVGMVESPMIIKAYLKNISRSELFVVMTCGMSTVAGSIMVLYASLLGPIIEGALGHVLAASIINVFGAILLARILVPGQTLTNAEEVSVGLSYDSSVDAVIQGTSDGANLVVNVGAMLIVLISLVALVNYVIQLVVIGGSPLSLQRIGGWLFLPVAWSMGVPWAEAYEAGRLLGIKLVVNELAAYIEFSSSGEGLSEKTRLILTYALCGFANFGSLGIMVGGISTLAPDRRKDLVSLGPKTLLSGTLVACLTGSIVGIVG